MMTSRERVIAALTFNRPDRAPRQLWTLPYVSLYRQDELDALLAEYPMDIDIIPANPELARNDVQFTAQVGAYTDAWGSVWHVAEPGVIGEVRGPALADWSDVATFQPPWHLLRERDFSEIHRAYERSDKFILSDATARPFERMQFLRGTENLFIDLAYDTAEFRRLLEMVHDYYLEDIRGWCQTPVDGVFVLDDWGGNRGLLINPATWRELFKPLYKAYCDVIHAAGKFAFFHTDGNTSAIYGDLIEVGFDAINSQLFVMDIEELARQFKGKVTFWGEIDRQHVLPFGTPDDVRAAVMRVRRALDDGGGGLIGQCEWGKDNSRENIEMVFKAWLEPIVS
jgi:uroporphyrinogen decarboxylase